MENNKRILRIASFNVLNLILPETVYYQKSSYSKEDFEKKINWIAQMLQEMNADIVGFQEVFQKEALEQAIARSGIYEGAALTMGENGPNLPRVALLSRFPVNKSKIIDTFPENSIIDVENEITNEKVVLPYKKFSRPVLNVEVEISKGQIINFYVIHLKSKRPHLLDNEQRENHVQLAKATARSLFVRASEAVALRSILMENLLNKKSPVVVMGDGNDTGLSVTTRLLTGEPPFRTMPMNVKKNIWDVLLYQVQDIQARNSYNDYYYTHIHNGHYEALDHIMVSEELVGENPESIGRVSYVKLYNDHLIDNTLTNEKTKCWKTDHGLVCVTIELKQV